MPDTRLEPAADSTPLDMDIVGAATAWEVLSDGDDATYLKAGPEVDAKFFANVLLEPLPPEVAGHVLNYITVFVRVKRQSGSTTPPSFWITINDGTNQRDFEIDQSAFDNVSPRWVSGQFFTAPDGSAWEASDFPTLKIGLSENDDVGYVGDNTHRFYELYVMLTTTSVIEGIEPAREVLTRHVLEMSEPQNTMGFLGGLRHLDREIGDLVDVSDIDGESADEAGWGHRSWERRIHEVQEQELDLESMLVGLNLQDVRSRLVLYLDSARSQNPGAIDYPGVMRLDGGGDRDFARACPAWLEDVDGVLRAVGTNVEAVGPDGEMLERASTCWFARCGFKEELTGLTINGEGVNGSNAVADTDSTWFDLLFVPGSLLLTAGSPPSGDLEVIWPASATIPANTEGTVSIRYFDDDGEATSWWMRRGVDSKYWRASDQTWQVAKTWNALPVSDVDKARYVSPLVNVGASGTTLTIAVGVPAASAVAGQQNHVYKVQGEALPWASSDIVCSGAVETRLAAELSADDNEDMEVFDPLQGSWNQVYTPYFDSGDVTGETFVLRKLEFDNGNYQRLYYDGTNQRFVLHRHVGANDDSAVLDHALTRGTPVSVVARWTGTDGAFDEADYSLGLVVNETEGAWVASEALTDDPAGVMAFYDGSSYPDGLLADVVTWYWPMTTAEAARLALGL